MCKEKTEIIIVGKKDAMGYPDGSNAQTHTIFNMYSTDHGGFVIAIKLEDFPQLGRILDNVLEQHNISVKTYIDETHNPQLDLTEIKNAVAELSNVIKDMEDGCILPNRENRHESTLQTATECCLQVTDWLSEIAYEPMCNKEEDPDLLINQNQ